MKLIIAGGRDFEDYQQLQVAMFDYDTDLLEIVSGGAPGADSLGERFAEENNITVTRFTADWNKHGRAAGPLRNKQMADYASESKQ